MFQAFKKKAVVVARESFKENSCNKKWNMKTGECVVFPELKCVLQMKISNTLNIDLILNQNIKKTFEWYSIISDNLKGQI